jgi:hypothetical protein
MSKYVSRPEVVISLLSIAIILVFCLITSQLFFYECLWDCPPKRSFRELDLNLPNSLFPNGAKIYTLHYLRDDTGRDPAVASSSWDGGNSSYTVLKSATKAKASQRYNLDTRHNFFTRMLDGTEQYSDVIGYTSKVADESSIKCGYLSDDLRCIFIARYEEFNILFASSMGNKVMTNEDFLNVARYIDARMATLLNKNNP